MLSLILSVFNSVSLVTFYSIMRRIEKRVRQGSNCIFYYMYTFALFFVLNTIAGTKNYKNNNNYKLKQT